MRLLSPAFVRRFNRRIVNLHPALLPSFPGTRGIRDAYEAGVRITGVTVHLVDEGMDTGPILAQEALSVDAEESPESLEERIHALEHRLYPRTLAALFRGDLAPLRRSGQERMTE
jgi:phosphoribosylglycinamide formyltransferase-1